jgi:predicted ATPase
MGFEATWLRGDIPRRAGRGSVFMIHKVRLENFKGHMDTTVSLGRLTMLVGSNGSGKTSVLEALSMQSMLGTRRDLALQGERARMRLLRRGSDTLVVTSGGTRREGEGTRLPWSSRIELKRDDSAGRGTLLALALLTLLHGSPRSNLVLLDGLDHGLHPDAQRSLVRMIQDALTLEALDDVQVVATTHSPYMLDRMDLDDIQVFTLRPDGTVASKRLAEHPVAENARGAVSAGQLWSMDVEREWVLEGGCVDSSTGSSSC